MVQFCPAAQSDETGSQRVRWRDDRSGKSQFPPVTRIEEHLDNSLMLGMALIPHVGFEMCGEDFVCCILTRASDCTTLL